MNQAGWMVRSTLKNHEEEVGEVIGTQTHAAAGHAAEHAHGHPAHLQHHFETSEQQFESGKLGMWIFLSTEILLFAGLFCAYSVYRANHPEIFIYAHRFLEVKWGATNTVILLFSSFTMAMGVRAAQLNQQKLLVVMLTITLLCGFGFLGIKYIEYSHKIHEGLLWGTHYNPVNHSEAEAVNSAHGESMSTAHSDPPAKPAVADAASHPGAEKKTPEIQASTPYEKELLVQANETLKIEPSDVAFAPAGPAGLAAPALESQGTHHVVESPSNVHIFFGIYYVMTGLHGIHVIVGMIVIGWLIVRSMRGHFTSEYYTPVDLGGLYWHLVDLIWIYLFPLLYLIH